MRNDLTLQITEIEGRKTRLCSSPSGDMEIFADGIHGVTISSQLVKFNLYTVNPFAGGEEEEYREVVARVAMTLPTFIAVAQFMADRLKDLEQAGLIRSEEESAGQAREGESAD